MTSGLALWETVVATSRILGLPVDDVANDVRTYLEENDISCIPIDESIALAALEAFGRYGKGRHPAKLNLGDCFAYACARHHRVPLLYKGEDFALTDIEPA